MQVRRGETLNEHANFETFPNALLLLFRIATADEWTGIMDDTGVSPPLCSSAAGDCGTALGPLYVMSFTLLTGQIMLNLFTTIVIETFEEMDEVRRLHAAAAAAERSPGRATHGLQRSGRRVVLSAEAGSGPVSQLDCR